MARKGQGILLVYTDLIEPKYEEEFNAWYNSEYIPGYRKVPGVIYARRFCVVEGEVHYTTM